MKLTKWLYQPNQWCCVTASLFNHLLCSETAGCRQWPAALSLLFWRHFWCFPAACAHWGTAGEGRNTRVSFIYPPCACSWNQWLCMESCEAVNTTISTPGQIKHWAVGCGSSLKPPALCCMIYANVEHYSAWLDAKLQHPSCGCC